MTSWAEGSGKAFNDLDTAQTGVGIKLPGQRDVSADERRKYNEDLGKYQYEAGTQLVNATGGRLNRITDEMASSYKIGQAYDDSMWGGKQEYLKAAQQQPLGDVSDPSARLKAMSFITQDKPLKDGAMESQTDDTRNCAGSSIVGAAFLAEGPEGLKKVMKTLEAQDLTGGSTKKDPLYRALKAKLAKDPNSLTVADIQSLQQATTEVLAKNQLADKELVLDEDNRGIHGKTMDKFMKRSPELAKMFETNGMEIVGIDNDGALNDDARTGMDHWVVKMKKPDGKEAIYDPLARRGGQIIDFDEGVNHYKFATQDTVGKPD